MSEAIVDKYWGLIADRHDVEAFPVLDAAYREPQRAYHAWTHIVDLFTKLDDYSQFAARPDIVAAAIFWHDSVYLTRESDGRPRSDPENVRASAELFARHSRFDAMEAQAIHDMIMATASHMSAKATREYYPGFGQDLEFFLDLDLSSLAAPWPVFEQNLQDIQFEFSWVPEDAFYQSRLKMLATFIGGGDRLYRLSQTRALWLAQARANLERVDAELRSKLALSEPERDVSSN